MQVKDLSQEERDEISESLRTGKIWNPFIYFQVVQQI